MQTGSEPPSPALRLPPVTPSPVRPLPPVTPTTGKRLPPVTASRTPAPPVDDPGRRRGALVPVPWRRRVPTVVVAAVGVVALLAVAVHGGHGPLAVERPFNDVLTRERHHLNGPALFFADLNRPARLAVVLVATLALCIAGRSLRAVLTIVVALPATLAVCEGLKDVVDRRQILGLLSFPSGHVAVASVLVTAVVLLGRRHGPLGQRLGNRLSDVLVGLGVAAVLAVAASMVILGDHYVTDTIAGTAIGLSVTAAAATAVDLAVERFGRRR